MIDFQNAEYLKLRPVSNNAFERMVGPILIDKEQILASFQGVRDGIVFTDRRVIAINVQGVTGKKKDMTSLPYKKIQTFSVETSGVFDMDCELELWISSVGRVKFEFLGNCDVAELCRIISYYTL